MRTPAILFRPAVIVGVTVVAAVVLILGFRAAIDGFYDNATLGGLTADPTPVNLSIGSEELAVPANMIRSRKVRRGGPVERVDLAIHWPTFSGYSEDLDAIFKEAVPTAPIVYATIAPREAPLDSTGRLDSVYAQFFVGKAVPGANGLVGRQLNADSGYGGEVVYFTPGQAQPFVARCMIESTPEVPATCLRDVNIGNDLSLLYRFNRNLLDDWAALDAGVRALAAGFLKR